jgi:hypothetical protein
MNVPVDPFPSTEDEKGEENTPLDAETLKLLVHELEKKSASRR